MQCSPGRCARRVGSPRRVEGCQCLPGMIYAICWWGCDVVEAVELGAHLAGGAAVAAVTSRLLDGHALLVRDAVVKVAKFLVDHGRVGLDLLGMKWSPSVHLLRG